jgi:putative phosphoesterase
MKIAILSDIHDHVWKLAAVLQRARGADALICCGDLCSPFIIHQLGQTFLRPIHLVFGNNDADLFRITANARRYEQICIHGELFRGEFDGKRFAANHYDSIAQPLAASGAFDVVCFGHNHRFEITRIGNTWAINPGTVMGAAFAADGSWQEVASSFVIYETATGEANRYDV